jgi:hypothetical protein
MTRILLLVCCLLAVGRLFADVVTLDGGRQISGVVESGNTQEIHIKVGDRSETVDIHQVQAIQFGVSAVEPADASPAHRTASMAPAASEPAPAQPNTLMLHDGTRIAGRWWSLDATNLHFLENSQLRHYPRSEVSAVTFGNATLPALPARSTPQPATPAQPPAGAAPPGRPPATVPERSSAAPPATPAHPSGSAPAAASPRGRSQPDEIGMVYSWNGKVVIPLERSKASEHKSGSTQYWEMPGAQSSLRLSEDATLVFVVGLPRGVDPASYNLFVLETVNGGRRTRVQAGRRGSLATWPVDIVKQDDSRIATYVFTVRDLPPGEYSFSPSDSNDGYCFGVDPSAPGK